MKIYGNETSKIYPNIKPTSPSQQALNPEYHWLAMRSFFI